MRYGCFLSSFVVSVLVELQYGCLSDSNIPFIDKTIFVLSQGDI